MNNLKINKSLIYIIIVIIFFLQIELLAHRNSFSPKLVFQFYKKDIGLVEGIKNAEILSILNIIKKNNLKSFKLSDDMMKSRKIKQRVFESSYPLRYEKKSMNIITKTVDKNCIIKDRVSNIYLLICE